LDFAVRSERARTKFTLDNRTGGPACTSATAGGVEPSRPGEFHVWILELAGTHVFLRSQDFFGMASHYRALSQDLSERRPRDGQAGVLRSEYRSSRSRCGISAGGVAFNHVRRKDAPRIVYSAFPKISRWLENHSRSYVRSVMKLTSLHRFIPLSIASFASRSASEFFPRSTCS